MIEAMIFDVDGTLVASVDPHAEAWRQALATFGHRIAFDEIRGQIGKGGDQLMPVTYAPGLCPGPAQGEALRIQLS